MAAVSFSLTRGSDGFKVSDFTVGTLAPNAGEVELRVNLLDGQSVAVTRKDVVIALEAFERAIESGAIFSNKPPF